MNEQATMVIYSRKSRFTGKGESIENQAELCRQYIRSHFGDEAARAAHVYEDEGYSGGTLERPQFKRMMEAAKGNGFRAIVVYRLDRISRNIGDFAGLIGQLDKMQIGFISIREQFDTTSPMGRAMMYISSVFSQLERETIAERIRDNMHELAKTSRWLGGATPMGYASERISRVASGGKVSSAYKLKIIPEEARLVQLIFDTFLRTESLTKTESFLLRHGYITRNGKEFTRFSVKGILSNPVYMIADGAAFGYLTDKKTGLFHSNDFFDGVHGIMAYNRTLQQPGKPQRLRPMEEWIVAVGEHEGLIDGQSWIRVQALLARNKSKGYRKPRGNTALLSGRLFCGNCGDYMRPKMSSRRNAAGEAIYTYLCARKERSRTQCCGVKNADGNGLDGEVMEQLALLREKPLDFCRELKKCEGMLLRGREDGEEEMRGLEREISENQAAISRLLAAMARVEETGGEVYILEEINRLHEKGEGLERRREKLRDSLCSQGLSDAELQGLSRRLSCFADTLNAMAVEQKRAAIRSLVKAVIWDGAQGHLVLYGADYHYEYAQKPLCEDSK